MLDKLLQWCGRVLGYPKHFDILNDRDGSLYLRRYFLLGSSSSGSTNSAGQASTGNLFPRWKRAVYLHVMYRPDKDRCHHDHPWGFTTLVLWGGYYEEVSLLAKDGVPYAKVERYNRPGIVRRNKALHTHRVSYLPRGRCYTLVLRGPKERTWGFWSGLTPRWLKWTTFGRLPGNAKVLWCADSDYVPEHMIQEAEHGGR